ncbi:MAG: hypothetical protein JWM18_1048 [Chloroflexi bacterium]|nr:hypothetical protein [Chloroflexota bacterium]
MTVFSQKESDVTRTEDIQVRVGKVFDRLASGNLSPPSAIPQSGWEMTLPSGDAVVRSTLQGEAAELIALGAEAVPYLLPFVTNENPALSYVAIYALQEITGERPWTPYFDSTDSQGDRRNAVQAWREWYEARS